MFNRISVLMSVICRPYDGRTPVDMNHPQRLLNIEPPKFPNNQVPVGFLGYAVNLVHLRQDHVQIRVATRHGEVGLRESLFFNLFGYLQVYDTRQHMNSAKDGLRNLGGAVSLDGGMIKKNQRQVLGRRRYGPASLGGTLWHSFSQW